MAKLLTLLAALLTLGACSLTNGSTNGGSPVTYRHVCQTGGLGCG